jgi:protein-S-isoprenylcysteine O-methyltransferase Ste14
MSELDFFNGLITGWFILAVVVFILLLFFAAPYGRYNRGGWGPSISDKAGWVIMEAVSPTVFALCFILGDNAVSVTGLAFLAMWLFHYIYRAFIYPLRMQSYGRTMPLAIVAMAMLFNSVNGYLNGRYIYTFADKYTNEWLLDPRFIAGVALFAAGVVINRRSDNILRNLRRPGETGYHIPRGELYKWVSCPNYLGEVVIWAGWALATWSLAGLAFAVWTAANLAPRARQHHCWYRQNFPDYPAERKALLPGLW